VQQKAHTDKIILQNVKHVWARRMLQNAEVLSNIQRNYKHTAIILLNNLAASFEALFTIKYKRDVQTVQIV
jgi:hypothetical protein